MQNYNGNKEAWKKSNGLSVLSFGVKVEIRVMQLKINDSVAMVSFFINSFQHELLLLCLILDSCRFLTNKNSYTSEKWFFKSCRKGFWQSGLNISEQNNLQGSVFRQLPKENE